MAKIKQSDTRKEPVHKRTSQGGSPIKTSSLNKSKKASYKPYRGQGK